MRACISIGPGAVAAGPELEDLAEVLGIVGVHQHPRPRQVKVVQPRQPEAQRGRAQQQRPVLALGFAQFAAGTVGFV